MPTSTGGTGLTSFTSGGAVYATSTSVLTTGTLPVTAGGSGKTSFTNNSILIGNNGNSLKEIGTGSSGQILISGGSLALPTWTSTPTFGQGAKSFTPIIGDNSTNIATTAFVNSSFVEFSKSPTFTGTVSGITAQMVGLGNVTNESKATMFTNPSFTGTVSIPTTNNFQFNSLGIGTASSGVTGEIRATNNITAYYSDSRLKDFKGKITEAVEKIKQINGYYYTGNEEAAKLGYDTKKLQVGISAQELEKVLPEVVTEAPIGHGYLTVWYEKITPLLIEAIKEQQIQLDNQAQKIQEFEKIIFGGQ